MEVHYVILETQNSLYDSHLRYHSHCRVEKSVYGTCEEILDEGGGGEEWFQPFLELFWIV